MLLSTLRCVVEHCDQQYTEDATMWQVTAEGKRLGWTVREDDTWFCPEHSPDSPGAPIQWVVGCATCGFEEEMSEEEAKYEYEGHECESETWIWSPEKVLAKQRHRVEYEMKRAQEQAQVRVATTTALTKQEQIEKYAASWVRLRNTICFWNKVAPPGADQP